MKKNTNLVSPLPETRLMTTASLWVLLEKYSKVVLKPRNGKFGYGVIQISREGENRFKIHSENRKITLKGKKQTQAYLKQNIRYRDYIIQRWISLAQIKGCPFDLRVVVQRRRNFAWEVMEVTGKLARIAKKGYIITNVSQKILPVKTAIHLSKLRNVNVNSLLIEIDNTALLAAKQLSHFYKNKLTFGFDIGIDNKGKVWIIEVNLWPDHHQFFMLKNKAMYRRIKSYTKAKKFEENKNHGSNRRSKK